MFSSNKGTFQGAISTTDFANLGAIVNKFVPYVFAAASMFLLFYLIVGGFGFLTSKGDPKALEAARQKITNAIIGFVIIFVAYWLVQLLAIILGLQGVFGGGSVSPPTP